MNNINLLIKPVSSSCDLNCTYCYYNDISNKRSHKSYGKMDIDLAEVIIKKIFVENFDNIKIVFQGGEPTLAGLDFFYDFTKIVNKYKKNEKIFYSIQTNAYSLNEKWIKFFKDYHFLVGVSLDGTKDIHNINRKTVRGEDTFNKVMKSLNLLKNSLIDFNVLSVVTKNLSKHINTVYNFYKTNNFRNLQFIPCLDPLYEKNGNNLFSLTPELYEDFLKKLFDLWFDDVINNNYIYISFFENLLMLIKGKNATTCGMNGQCYNQMIIESNGDVYPCDFYVLDNMKIGNIKENSFKTISENADKSDFIVNSKTKNPECLKCKWFNLCRGGCKRERNNDLFYYCSSYKNFFDYSIERLLYLTEYLNLD